MSFQVNVFGTKASVGQGGRIRKSPGTNWLASCVGKRLSGQKYGSRAAVREGLASTARNCAGTKGKA